MVEVMLDSLFCSERAGGPVRLLPKRPSRFRLGAVLPILALFAVPSLALADDENYCADTVNPSECFNTCGATAELIALGCALSGSCGPEVAIQYLETCLANLTPPLPAPATPATDENLCKSVPMLVSAGAGRPTAALRGISSLARPHVEVYASCDATFVDPVPQLQNPDGTIVTSHASLAKLGRPVTAIATDSAARVVVRIKGRRVGQHLTVALRDESGNTGLAKELIGSISTVGGSEAASQLALQATATCNGPMAFVVYRPPADFVRIDGFANPQDMENAMRSVKLAVTSTDDDLQYTSTLNLWRPPVVLVHGLWDSPDVWVGFLGGGDGRFSVSAADYARSLAGQQVSPNGTTPSYDASTLAKANANQLGFAYNAPTVMAQIRDALARFRSQKNAAVAQVDVVAHSMGGVIVRTAETLPAFNDHTSFGIGNIHKLITVGTPHFGSPLATQLLADSCLRPLFAQAGRIAFGQQVVLTNGQVATGATWDLKGDPNGLGGGLSPALQALKDGSGHGVPTYQIAGQMGSGNLSSIPVGLNSALASMCALALHPSPLSAYISSSNWPNLFNNQPSDAVVAVTSQLAGAGDRGNTELNVIHSHALSSVKLLGHPLLFTGPAELDLQGSPIPQDIIDLLQKPVLGSTSPFHPLPN
jgi:pimeloyl-ACP methyl ester carboxylesterase